VRYLGAGRVRASSPWHIKRVDEEHHQVDGDQPDDGLERIENEHGNEADNESGWTATTSQCE